MKQLNDTHKKPITLGGLKEAWQLYKYMRPYRTEYLIGIFFLLGSSLANLAFPKLLGELVNAGAGNPSAIHINKVALILAGLLIIQSVFSYFRTVLFVNVTEKTLADIRQETYNHLIKLPITFFEQHRVGELNSRLSSDISLLQETLTSTLAEFIRQIIIIIGGIALLAYTSIELTIFMLAILPAVVLAAVFFGRFIRGYSKKAQTEIANSNVIVEETLQGIQSVKSFTNELFEITRYKEKSLSIAQIGIKGGKYRGAFASFLIFGLFGSLVAVIWKGSLLLAAGEMNSGDLFSFVLYSGFIGGTIGGMASIFAQMQRFLGATEDLFALFHQKEELIVIDDSQTSYPPFKGGITFNNLNFAYPSRPDSAVLKNINFTIAPNQQVALVGSSGAGKSTITALLLQLYPTDTGSILIDDIEINNISLTHLRSQIGIVPQECYLFGGTIKENIAYGKPGATDDEIIETAKHANAWEFIEHLPDGLNTLVGERGTQLSGGQRQRIAIARALLKNPRILILDEATSALDSTSEKLVQEALTKLMKGRTTLVIAHRLSTIRHADLIMVIDKGVLVETGTHKALIEKENGIYRNLSQLQGIFAE